MAVRIALIVEYDGSGYCGWQNQKNGISVQQRLEEALRKLTGDCIAVHGAGRTDAGVHAIGQCAHFDTQSRIPPHKFAFAMNAVLPPDIRIRQSAQVPDTFHARFDAQGKHYRYTIWNAPHASALQRNFAMHVPVALDINAMRRAAQSMQGTKDFAALCSTKTTVKDTVRTVHEVTVAQERERIRIDVRGNGFLYNMVRIIAGTLIYVGEGKLQAEDIARIMESKDRRLSGVTAQPQGLCLMEVFYQGL